MYLLQSIGKEIPLLNFKRALEQCYVTYAGVWAPCKHVIMGKIGGYRIQKRVGERLNPFSIPCEMVFFGIHKKR